MNLFKQIKDRSAAVVQTVQVRFCTNFCNLVGNIWQWTGYRLDQFENGIGSSTWFGSWGFSQSGRGNSAELCHWARETIPHGQFFQQVVQIWLKNKIFPFRRLRCEYPSAPLENILPPVFPGPPPTVNYLLKMCRSMTQFLRQQPNGFVVFYGLMGEHSTFP